MATSRSPRSSKKPPPTKSNTPKSGSNTSTTAKSPAPQPTSKTPPTAKTSNGPTCTPAWPPRPAKKASSKSPNTSKWLAPLRKNMKSVIVSFLQTLRADWCSLAMEMSSGSAQIAGTLSSARRPPTSAPYATIRRVIFRLRRRIIDTGKARISKPSSRSMASKSVSRAREIRIVRWNRQWRLLWMLVVKSS